jgi:hypothetical protein
MIKLFLILTFPLLFVACSQTTKHYHEKYYQTLLCNELEGKMEYVLKDRTRVDCLTGQYAIEVDFAKKWAESIGQSLYYADMTGKKPAVGLIMDIEKDQRYFKRLETIAKKYEIKIFIIEKEK